MNSSSCNIKASSLGTEDSSSYLSDMLASLMDCINPVDTLTVENSLQLAKLVQGKLLSLCNSIWCSTHPGLWSVIPLRILESRGVYKGNLLQWTPLFKPVVGGNGHLAGKWRLYLASGRKVADPAPSKLP